MAEYTRGPRMVAGGAAGGFEEDFVPMSDERAAALSREAEQATLDEIKKMIAPPEKPKKAKGAMSDKRAAELLAKADAATNELIAKIGGPVTMTKAAATAARRKTAAKPPAMSVASEQAAAPSSMMSFSPMASYAPQYTPISGYALPASGPEYPAPGYEQQFMTAYPSAVMSYPNRTVGYQYAAGAPVTPYMSPVASRPIPVEPNMSLATAMSSRRRGR